MISESLKILLSGASFSGTPQQEIAAIEDGVRDLRERIIQSDKLVERLNAEYAGDALSRLAAGSPQSAKKARDGIATAEGVAADLRTGLKFCWNALRQPRKLRLLNQSAAFESSKELGRELQR